MWLLRWRSPKTVLVPDPYRIAAEIQKPIKERRPMTQALESLFMIWLAITASLGTVIAFGLGASFCIKYDNADRPCQETYSAVLSESYFGSTSPHSDQCPQNSTLEIHTLDILVGDKQKKLMIFVCRCQPEPKGVDKSPVKYVKNQ